MNKYYGLIYCAINIINGKIYIGLTTIPLEKRKIKHKSTSKKGDTPFCRAIRKYGWKSFNWKIIDYGNTKEELSDLERLYIDMFCSAMPEIGYNNTYGGEISFPTFSTIKKMKKSQSNRSEETRRRISESKKGEKNGMYGKKGVLHHNSRRIECIETKIIYNSIAEAKREMKNEGIGNNHIIDVCRGKRKTCGKLHWKYVKE